MLLDRTDAKQLTNQIATINNHNKIQQITPIRVAQ